jgi:hypothetical protein
MSYLFIKKISFKEKSLYYSHKKLKIEKNYLKKTFLVGFLGGFFWVGFLLPTLLQMEMHRHCRRRRFVILTEQAPKKAEALTFWRQIPLFCHKGEVISHLVLI